MIDVEKLTETINELESQSRDIKRIIELYHQFYEASQEIASTVNAQNELHKDIEKVMERADELQKLYFNSIEDLEKFKAELLKIAQNISSENNKLYMDYQNFTSSKLELVKSDLQVEVRNAMGNVEKQVNTLSSDIHSHKNSIDNSLSKMSTGIKVGAIIGSIGLILNIIILMVLLLSK